MQDDIPNEELTFDTFYLGQKLPSYLHTLSISEIDHWCYLVGEDNPVYLDDNEAKLAGFEGRIAPPMMIRVFSHMQNVFKGFDRKVPGHSIHAKGWYRFIKPVRPGDTIRTTGFVKQKYIKNNRKFLIFEFTCINQRGECVAKNTHTTIWPK